MNEETLRSDDHANGPLHDGPPKLVITRPSFADFDARTGLASPVLGAPSGVALAARAATAGVGAPTPFLSPSGFDVSGVGTPSVDLPGFDLPAAAPGFDVPAFDVPAFDVPAFDVPAFDVPAFDVPAFDVPAFDAPAFDVPAFDAPAFDVPAFDAPAFDAPAFDVPAFDVPAFDAPAFEVPAFGAPAFDVSAIETPSLDVPSFDVPAIDTPGLDVPSFDVPAFGVPTLGDSGFSSPQRTIPEFTAPQLSTPRFESGAHATGDTGEEHARTVDPVAPWTDPMSRSWLGEAAGPGTAMPDSAVDGHHGLDVSTDDDGTPGRPLKRPKLEKAPKGPRTDFDDGLVATDSKKRTPKAARFGRKTKADQHEENDAASHESAVSPSGPFGSGGPFSKTAARRRSPEDTVEPTGPAKSGGWFSRRPKADPNAPVSDAEIASEARKLKIMRSAAAVSTVLGIALLGYTLLRGKESTTSPVAPPSVTVESPAAAPIAVNPPGTPGVNPGDPVIAPDPSAQTPVAVDPNAVDPAAIATVPADPNPADPNAVDPTAIATVPADSQNTVAPGDAGDDFFSDGADFAAK